MSLYKQAKDQLTKYLLGRDSAPAGLVELNRYFRFYGAINFQEEKQEDGSLVVISKDFKYGTIITHIKKNDDHDEVVKDAILTAFEVPSSYAAEAGVHRVKDGEYAFA